MSQAIATAAKAGATLSAVHELLENVREGSVTNLFAYTKPVNIASRVFVDESLSREEILKPLMQNLFNLYTSVILTAFNMNKLVVGGRTVRDLMGVVSTESMVEPKTFEELATDFFNTNPKKASYLAAMEASGPTAIAKNTSVGSKDYDGKDGDVLVPQGRLLTVEFDREGTDGKTLKINMMVNLHQRFVPTEVMMEIINMNFGLDVYQRWLQYKAGELRFLQDFLFNNDRMALRRRAMDKDKTGILSEIENHKAVAKMKVGANLVTSKLNQKKNIANTILVYESRSLEMACKRSNLDLKNYNKRQRFFDDSMSMILCVIDTYYQRVTIYYNGLQSFSEFSYDQLKRTAKNDSLDILTAMKNFANNMAPR